MTVETRMGKITACREVLNQIATSFLASANRHNEKDMPNTAQYESDIANAIINALDKTGFYDDFN